MIVTRCDGCGKTATHPTFWIKVSNLSEHSPEFHYCSSECSVADSPFMLDRRKLSDMLNALIDMELKLKADGKL